MEKDPFKEYLRESEPDKAYKGYAWSTATPPLADFTQLNRKAIRIIEQVILTHLLIN